MTVTNKIDVGASYEWPTVVRSPDDSFPGLARQLDALEHGESLVLTRDGGVWTVKGPRPLGQPALPVDETPLTAGDLLAIHREALEPGRVWMGRIMEISNEGVALWFPRSFANPSMRPPTVWVDEDTIRALQATKVAS